MNETVIVAARHFMDDVTQVTSLGAGRINDTYLVANDTTALVLRKINRTVFPHPKVVIENFSILTEHFSYSQAEHYFWPRAIPSINGQLWYEDTNGGVWHAQHYLILKGSAENLQNAEVINACGACLAHFHQIAATDLKLPLKEPLPYFHHLPFYLNQYDQAQNILPSEKEVFCTHYIAKNREKALDFTRLNETGLLGRTVIHGDPKSDNFVFGENSIGLIDFDTTYFGAVHIDLGDALRSFCNLTGEDVYGPDFNVKNFESFMDGYMSVGSSSLTDLQKDAVYDAVFAISFELGLRFYTDHLCGDTYFKIIHKGDNLKRSIIQFQFCQKMEKKKALIMAILKKYSSTVHDQHFS